MQCQRCGYVSPQDARFCSHCGASAFVQPVRPYVSPVHDYGRVSRHLQSLGTLWLIYAALRLLTGMAGLFFVHSTFLHHVNHFGWGPWSNGWAGMIWPFAATSLVMSLALALLTGFALITRQPWGRVLAIIYGVLTLIHFPFGTAVGIYTLWVLAPGLSGYEYNQLSRTATAQTQA